MVDVLTLKAETVFDPVDGSGQPRGASMSDVRTWSVEMQRLLLSVAQTGGGTVFNTKAAMDADLNHAAGKIAFVVADGANNGVYKKSGASGAGSWVFQGALFGTPSLADLAEARAATEAVDVVTPATAAVNRVMPLTSVASADGVAYTASCTILGALAPASGEQFQVTWPTPNLSRTPTLAVNGDTARSLRDRNGATLPLGALIAGATNTVRRTATVFNILDDLSAQQTAAKIAVRAPTLNFKRHKLDVSHLTLDPAASGGGRRRIVIMYGQSNSLGAGAYPALSLTAVPGATMMGDSVLSLDQATVTWVQQGSAVFKPLVATVATGATNRSPLSAERIRLFDIANVPEGEAPVIAAVQGLAADYGSYVNANNVTLVAAACGVGGKSLAELSEGAAENLWQRVTDAMALCKTFADALGESSACQAFVYCQAERDYSDNVSYATRTSGLVALKASVEAAALAQLGQARKPPLFLVHVAGDYVGNLNLMQVANADADFARDTAGVFLVGPTYHGTDRTDQAADAHLDANGARYIGEQCAKVMRHVLIEGRDWQPCEIVRVAKASARVIEVDVHVPVPPLQVRPVTNGHAEVAFADYGFRVEDTTGFATIVSVAVEPRGRITITIDRDLTGTDNQIFVWYGESAVHGGRGNICDSDPTVSRTKYEFTPDAGMLDACNIADRVNRPYPLWNWLMNARRDCTFDVREPVDYVAASTPSQQVIDDPADLGDDLIAQWDMSVPGSWTDVGGAASQWNDVVGGVNVTQGAAGNRPTINATGGPTGGPCLDFNGTSQFLESVSLGDLPIGTEGCEIWVIAKNTANAASDTTVRECFVYGDNGTGINRALRRIGNGNINRASISIGASALHDDGVLFPWNAWEVVGGRYNEGFLAGRIHNGEFEPSGFTGVSFNTTAVRLRIGASVAATASLFWQGSIEAIFVTKPLNGSKRAAWNSFLMTRAGL